MPRTRKMAGSVHSTSVRAAPAVDCRSHLVVALRGGRKSLNIHATSRVIWGIPVQTAGVVGAVLAAVAVNPYLVLMVAPTSTVPATRSGEPRGGCALRGSRFPMIQVPSG